MNLPKVNPATCFSVEQAALSGDDSFVFDYLREIKSKNPIVGMWIERFSKKTNDAVGSLACAAITYKLLESQSEADKMNKEFDI
jgi:hypothetical protein